MSAYLKDSADVLDYLYDFGPILGTDTILGTPTVTATPPGLTVAPTGKPTTNTTTTVTAWISGGTVGQRYDVTYRIGTSAGRTLERSIRVTVIER